MNLDDTKKRVQKYLNSNKRYPLIVDVQTREDLANIAEYFKVGSNKFPAIEEFCNQDEAINWMSYTHLYQVTVVIHL